MQEEQENSENNSEPIKKRGRPKGSSNRNKHLRIIQEDAEKLKPRRKSVKKSTPVVLDRHPERKLKEFRDRRAKSAEKPLTDVEVCFVDEYMKDLNMLAAGRRMGLAPVTVKTIMARHRVSAAIDLKLIERGEEAGVTSERVLRMLAHRAFYDPRRIFNEDGTLKEVKELGDSEAFAIAGFEVKTFKNDKDEIVSRVSKVRLSDRSKDIDLIMRHLGMFNDKQTVTIESVTPEAIAEHTNKMMQKSKDMAKMIKDRHSELLEILGKHGKG